MIGPGATVEQPVIHSRGSLRTSTVCLVGLLWLASILVGFWWLLQHDTKVKALSDISVSSSGVSWNLPDHLRSRYVADQGEIRAIFSLHPKCPCTRNSLASLASLLSDATVTTRCTFLVFTPDSDPTDWMTTAIVKTASELPNSELIHDRESATALSLGLTASGSVIVVDEFGRVLFQGGITAGRSCSGENPGAHALAAILRGESVQAIAPPVFGCSLSERDSAPEAI